MDPNSPENARLFLGIPNGAPVSAYAIVDSLRYRAKYLFKREHLSDLHAVLFGYHFAMILHNMKSSTDELSFDHFQTWMEGTLNARDLSWCPTLLQVCGSEEIAFAHFFRLLDEYRALPQFQS